MMFRTGRTGAAVLAVVGLGLAGCDGPTEPLQTVPSTTAEMAPAFTSSGVGVSSVSLANPSFESGYAGWVYPGTPGQYVDIGQLWQASDGTWSVDLNGFFAGWISQDISTVAGVEYTVSFDLAGNPGSPQGVKTVEVSAAGTSATYSFNTTGRSPTSMGWESKTFTFTATGTTTTLMFKSLYVGSGHPDRAQGPALDNVRVTFVPPDADGDGVTDGADNCPADANADQADLDGDGAGDACDSDIDGDGVSNGSDAFPHDAAESVDTDGDGIGNNADADDDGDGQSDADETACGSDALSGASRSADLDGDDAPDCVDPDDDNDGVADATDAFPRDPSEWADSDGDGVGDNGDAFPNDGSESRDSDGDGVGDNADAFDASIMTATVTIGACDSGVANKHLGNGSWFNDLIALAKSSSTNHGQFVTAVAKLADGWKKAGLITGQQQGAIVSCAAKSK